SGNNIGDASVVALAGSPHLARLERLSLWRCRISDEGANALAGSAYLGRLVELDLGENSIGNEGARALVRAPQLAGLKRLALTTRPLSADCLEELWQRLGEGLFTSRSSAT